MKVYNEYKVIAIEIKSGYEFEFVNYVSRTDDMSGFYKVLDYYPLHNYHIKYIKYIRTITEEELLDYSRYINLTPYLAVESWYDRHKS